MNRGDLGDLLSFLAVAEEQSFTRAAARLGTTQSSLSHTVRRLEASLGLRLLSRTTRSVAPTEAGAQLIETLRPALKGIEAKLMALGQLRERPAGTVRLTTSLHAAQTILWPKIGGLLADYPDLTIELSIDSGLTDIVTDRFDAGVRLGESIHKDMIAVPIGPPLRMAVIGAPSYFETRAIPESPHDLPQHSCINLRFTTGGHIYAWEFSKGDQNVNARVDGQAVFNDVSMVVAAAEEGHGLAFVMEDRVIDAVSQGRLIRVLEDWCEPFAGYHLYYPSRRQASSAFKLVLDTLRHGASRGDAQPAGL